MASEIKFFWNGIKVDGKLHLVSISDHMDNDGTITIYGKDYAGVPRIEGLSITNDTDSQTDYFCNDVARVSTKSLHYQAVLSAYQAKQARKVKRQLPTDAPAATSFEQKLLAFAVAIEMAELESLIRGKVDCEANRHGAKVKVVPGRKYTKVDVGSSGRYMVDPDGNIFGCKGYGVVHLGRPYGTLDNPVIRGRY